MSLRPILTVTAALLLAAPGAGADASGPLDDRMAMEVPAPPPPGVTLLEPAWLLPPIESLDAELAAAGLPGGGHLAAPGRADATSKGAKSPSGGPLSYSLSDHLSAQLRYRRSQGFDRSSSRALRDDASTAFSTQPNRDVVDLNMSWDLAGNTLGLGYQLQSSAGGVWSSAATEAEGGLSRFMPGSEQATHSLMFGVTRPWGAPAPAPAVVLNPPPLVPDLDVAVADGTPTPVP